MIQTGPAAATCSAAVMCPTGGRDLIGGRDVPDRRPWPAGGCELAVVTGLDRRP